MIQIIFGVFNIVLILSLVDSANIPIPISTDIVRNKLPNADYKEPVFQWIGHIEKKTFYSVHATSNPDDTMTWATAMDHCQELGMSLATIDSLAQDNLIANFLSKNGFAAWLSGTDYMSEGEWYWFKTRTSFDTTYTDSGFNPIPIFGPNEIKNCLYTTYLKNWYQANCDDGIRRAICQFP